MILECLTNSDCTGDSDTCVSNLCFCGTTEKCTGRTDTCVMEKCKCGENEECSETEFCSTGECRGILIFDIGKILFHQVKLQNVRFW